MNRKNILIYGGLLVLSVVINEAVAFIDAFRRNSFIAGESGLPLKSSSSALFGEASTNYVIWLIDVLFWFIVIILVWKLVSRLINR